MPESRAWTFGELAAQGHLEFGDGYRTKRVEHGRPGLPILRAANVVDGRIQLGFSDYVHVDYRRAMSNKTSRPGDVVLTTKGTVGRVALMLEDSPEFVYSPQICFFRMNAQSVLLPRYLYYWFKGDEFWRQAGAIKDQTDMADYINLADIEKLWIRLPPVSAQRSVVEMLGALDDKIAVNERIADTALELAKYWYERSRANVSNLREVSIGDVADVLDGPHATPTKTSEGPWYFSISSLKRGRLDLSESTHVTHQDFVKWTRRVTPRAGDLLFSYETRLGEAALMPAGIQGCLGRRMALMRPRAGGINSIFLLFSYLGREFQETIRRRAVTGATVERIPLAELPGWPIRVLDSEGRESLADLLGGLHDRMLASERESNSLHELRDILLPKLLAEELRIRNAEKVAEEAV